jgi:membrane-associated phospholipid phosphatase
MGIATIGGVRHRVRPEEVILAAFAVALATIMLATGRWYFTAFRHPRFLQVVGGLAVAVLLREAWRARRLGVAAMAALRVFRDFLPFFVVLLFYETLHDLTPVLRPQVVDGTLAAIDRALFGVDVSYWLGGFATPSLTRVMVWCYASYFVAPVMLAAAIYYRGEARLFRQLMVSGVVTTVLGFLGYLCVPAVGPYVFQAELFPTRLPGGGAETHLFIKAIDDLKGVARDCFPSLHTAHTTVVLVYALRFRRWVGLAYLPVALGLYVSTLYLRMHYAVDVAAGFATAAAAVWLGPRIEAWWTAQRPAAPGSG